MRMVLLRSDEFEMGSSPSEIRRIRNEWSADENILQAEQPNHKVRISRPFFMGKYPVTVGDFKKFVSETGYRTTAEKQGWAWGYDETKKHWAKVSGLSWKKPGAKWDDHPVTCVSSVDAEAFCDWLSRKENRRYYLPTEAQWEFAARGGKDGDRYPWGNQYPDGTKLNIADRKADLPWADRLLNDGYERTSPVGNYDPNGFWLYDMVGNVWQFCSDYYDPKAYEGLASSVTTDPTGPANGKKRVVRGGNWAFGGEIARNAFRFGVETDLSTDFTGFRVAAAAMGENLTERSSENVLNPEYLQLLMGRIRELVAAGRRLEARKVIEKTLKDESKVKLLPADIQSFIQNALESVVDVSKDNKLQSFTNTMGMEMIRIPGGSFVMGSSETDISWAMATLAQGQPVSIENEFPFHKVRISKPFFLASTEVTVGQFQAFVDETGYVTDGEDDKGGQVFNARARRFDRKEGSSWKNPGWAIEPEQPVAMISHNDAVAFVEWLTAKEKLPYKLPTEAQWEFAARGGLPSAQFPWGDELPDGRRANYADKNKDFEWSDRNSDGGYKFVAPVGSYEPNSFGLYDMAGNVLEWVRDYYGEDYYRFSPEIDPEGPGHGENRVMKGGEWTFGATNLRCAFRGWARPDLAFYNSGFRVEIEPSNTLRDFYFGADFLTKQWVPGSDQRYVATMEAKQKERIARQSPAVVESKPKVEELEEPVLKGLLVLDFSPKSDAKKAGMRRGDIIIEYNGVRELSAERLIALSAAAKKEKAKPHVVFVRDGYEYSVKVSPGFLGVSISETTVKTPQRRQDTPREAPPSEKGSKSQDWT
jgi:formylglycine-generating enzyme required for sulfatase activity